MIEEKVDCNTYTYTYRSILFLKFSSTMFPIFGIVVPWGWFISCKPSNIFLCFGLNWICWPVVLTGAGGAPFRSSEQGLPPSSPLSICNICQRTSSSSSSSAPHFQKQNKKTEKLQKLFQTVLPEFHISTYTTSSSSAGSSQYSKNIFYL